MQALSQEAVREEEEIYLLEVPTAASPAGLNRRPNSCIEPIFP